MHITYFVHSTTEDNINRVASGWNDVPVSALGEEQSIELKTTIGNHNFQAVYSSDLLRTRQTAEVVFGSNVIYDSRLRECNYGAHNGGPAGLINEFVTASSTAKFPEGESLVDVEQRVHSLLADLAAKHEGQHIAFVSHRFPQLALDVLVNQVSWAEALQRDWRASGNWQPGWVYDVAPVLRHLVDSRPSH